MLYVLIKDEIIAEVTQVTLHLLSVIQNTTMLLNLHSGLFRASQYLPVPVLSIHKARASNYGNDSERVWSEIFNW